MGSKNHDRGVAFEIPPNANLKAMFFEAQKVASNYIVLFIREKIVFGSGTLVTCGDIHGILTADHVAAHPLTKKEHSFSICYREDFAHVLHVDASQFQNISFGDSTKNPSEDSGPDLSLMMITDDDVLVSLKSKKSFLPLGDEYITDHCQHLFKEIPWWVSGSPQESTDITIHRGSPLTQAHYLHATAEFISLETAGDFDYLRMGFACGIDGYPKDCGGMSGGGIWMLGKQATPEGAHDIPILQGVLFHQSAPLDDGAKRILKGHGPRSVHNRLVKLVKRT